MFIAGSTLFTVGTLLAAFAANPALLVTGRIVQGVGAAALSPAAVSRLLLTFPGQQRARAMSIWGAASALGGATGAMAGGLLLGTFGWSSAFFVTVPVSVAAVVLARTVLDEAPLGARRPFDRGGAATIICAVVALVYGALGGADHGWTSPAVVATLVGSATLLGAFVLIERRTADRLVPLDLFRNRTLSTAVTLAVLGGAACASTFVLVALYLQQALYKAPQQAGLAMLPGPLAEFAFSLALLPRIIRALGPQRSLVTGPIVLAGGHLWLANAPPGAGYQVAVLPTGMLSANRFSAAFTAAAVIALVSAALGSTIRRTQP